MAPRGPRTATDKVLKNPHSQPKITKHRKKQVRRQNQWKQLSNQTRKTAASELSNKPCEIYVRKWKTAPNVLIRSR